jgi:hypothetical protein
MKGYLDIRTLSFVGGIISSILFLIMFYVYMTRKTYPGFREWVISFLLVLTTWILVSLRGIVPDYLSVVVANLFGAAYIMLIDYGLIAFTAGKQRMGWHIFSLAFLMTTFLYFTYYSPNVNIRIIIFCCIIVAYCIRCIIVVYMRIPLILPSSNPLLIFALSLAAFWYTVRFFFTLFLEHKISDFMAAGAMHGLMIIVTLTAYILIALSLIIMTLQRVEHDFLMAQNEIKTLKGFLPICSSCKRIRDDKGYWNQIEAYISDHSEAEFSHGICPDCMKKLYPEFDE